MEKATTATMKSFEDFERHNKERIIDARVRHFFERWQPKDPYEAQKFSGDFFMLIQEVHRDANVESRNLMAVLTEQISLNSLLQPRPITKL